MTASFDGTTVVAPFDGTTVVAPFEGTFVVPFEGTFDAYALVGTPGTTRVALLCGWLSNLTRIRRECQQGKRTRGAPYFNFDEKDMAIIESIARDGGHSEEIVREINLLLRNYNLRRKEILAFNEGLQQLRAIAEELNRLEQQPKEIAQQLDFLSQQKALLAPLQQELAQQQQEFELQLLNHNKQQKKLDKNQQLLQNGKVSDPEMFQDIIFTLDVMDKPVIATDGFTYEKRCILEWFQTKRTSPMTGALLLSTQLIPNHSLKSQINQWREQQTKKAINAQDKTSIVAKYNFILGILCLLICAVFLDWI
jgi:hypothetical protein